MHEEPLAETGQSGPPVPDRFESLGQIDPPSQLLPPMAVSPLFRELGTRIAELQFMGKVRCGRAKAKLRPHWRPRAAPALAARENEDVTRRGDSSDIHALEPEDFEKEVHSFQHWFEAVEGYLTDLDHGHRSDLDDPELNRVDRDRLVTTLCNYAVGETAALEASSGLIRIAPNRQCKVFLSTQVVDEGRHVEVMLHRMSELGVTDPEGEVERRAGGGIKAFRDRLLELVEAKAWEAAIFAQNVILEAMEFAVFETHAKVADPVTADMLERILRDERRHIGFGENVVGRRLSDHPELRPRILRVKSELDHLVLETLEETLEALRVPPPDRPQFGRNYLAVVERLGFAG
jgi:rubrerythrin